LCFMNPPDVCKYKYKYINDIEPNGNLHLRKKNSVNVVPLESGPCSGL